MCDRSTAGRKCQSRVRASARVRLDVRVCVCARLCDRSMAPRCVYCTVCVRVCFLAGLSGGHRRLRAEMCDGKLKGLRAIAGAHRIVPYRIFQGLRLDVRAEDGRESGSPNPRARRRGTQIDIPTIGRRGVRECYGRVHPRRARVQLVQIEGGGAHAVLRGSAESPLGRRQARRGLPRGREIRIAWGNTRCNLTIQGSEDSLSAARA